jgi:hypothetical protein
MPGAEVHRIGRFDRAGRMLQRLRESRGWSAARLAGELEAQGTTISRSMPARDSMIRMLYDWEAGTHRPRDYYVLFVLVYATSEELVARTIERGSDLDRLMMALAAMGVPVNRRRFFLNSAALAAGAVAGSAVPANLAHGERLEWVLRHPGSVDAVTVAELQATTRSLLRRKETEPSTVLLPDASRHLGHVALLREHAPAGALQQGLYITQAHAATLMGRLVWDVSGQRDHDTAEEYVRQSVAAASHTNNGAAKASPRLLQAYLAGYGRRDLHRGAALADQATRLAGDGTSHLIAAWASGVAAEFRALLREKRSFRLALDRAGVHFERVTPDDPMLGVYREEQLGGFEGVCNLYIGDFAGARQALERTAESLGVGKEKNKSVVLGDLATAFIRQGEPEQACGILHQAIDLVEMTRDGGGTRRAFRAGLQLRHWRNEPFAQKVQDRLLALGS